MQIRFNTSLLFYILFYLLFLFNDAKILLFLFNDAKIQSLVDLTKSNFQLLVVDAVGGVVAEALAAVLFVFGVAAFEEVDL